MAVLNVAETAVLIANPVEDFISLMHNLGLTYWKPSKSNTRYYCNYE